MDLRRSFSVVDCLSRFESLSGFHLVVYGPFMSLMLMQNFLILVPNSHEQWVVSGLTGSLLCFHMTFSVVDDLSGLSNITDFYSNDSVFLGRGRAFQIVCFGFHVVVHGRKKIVKTVIHPYTKHWRASDSVMNTSIRATLNNVYQSLTTRCPPKSIAV